MRTEWHSPPLSNPTRPWHGCSLRGSFRGFYVWFEIKLESWRLCKRVWFQNRRGRPPCDDQCVSIRPRCGVVVFWKALRRPWFSASLFQSPFRPSAVLSRCVVMGDNVETIAVLWPLPRKWSFNEWNGMIVTLSNVAGFLPSSYPLVDSYAFKRRHEGCEGFLLRVQAQSSVALEKWKAFTRLSFSDVWHERPSLPFDPPCQVVTSTSLVSS